MEETSHKEQNILNENLLLRKTGQQAADEREVLIRAFSLVRIEFESRPWIMEGRGSYPYDDDRYKEEVRYIMNAFNGINTNVWKEIKSGTYEYRNSIEKPLLDKIKELEEENKRLHFMIENGLGWKDMENDITLPRT